MNFSVDGATERLESATPGAPPCSVVECKSASWTYRYKDGYSVVLRGPLVAHVQLDLSNPGAQPHYLIKGFNFNASNHERCISLDSIMGRRIPPLNQTAAEELVRSRGGVEGPIRFESATLPPEPVNAFGIPQMTMRCLELAESCELMSDLMEFSQQSKIGPIDALKRLSEQYRQNNPHFAEIARQVAAGGPFSQAQHTSSAISVPNYPVKLESSPASTSSPIKTPAIAPALVPPPLSEAKPPLPPVSTAPTPNANTNTTGKRRLSNADSPKRTKARANQRQKR